jgi:large subunit ribosomal protein L18
MPKSTTKRTVIYRRKREGKTNYRKRLELLKGRQNRLVIRRTNKHIIMQIVSYEPNGDKIIAGVTSRSLEAMGWKHSGKNLPAAYLTGLLLAKAAKKKSVDVAILDLGLQTPIKGSRLYAALKGAIDGGMAIPASDEIFPTAERIAGGHIQGGDVAKDFAAMKDTIAKQ